MKNMSHHKNQRLKYRLFFMGGFIFLVLFLYIGHLFNLQIVENLIWEGRAKAVTQRSQPLAAQRGRIWDRHADKPLVINKDAFALSFTPQITSSDAFDPLIDNLASLLNIKGENLKEKILNDRKNSLQSIEIANNISFETISKLAESVEFFPGVTWNSKPQRWYNTVGAISHILGYVGDITIEELQILYNQGYTSRSSLGKSGVEKIFDSILRGRDGQIFRTVDVEGRNQKENLNLVEPQNGLDIVLTLDRKIQDLAQKALGPRKGALIVLKPSTGEILALVSYPSFDPNQFTSSDVEGFVQLSRNTDFPFLNRSIQSSPSPASTFKLVMAAAILGEKAFPLEKTINCRGVMTLGDREFWCHKRSGHGPVNFYKAIEISCNIYFGTIGAQYLGIDVINQYARAFGLGQATGIELDGENQGLVPGKNWKQETYHSNWTGGDTLNVSIGQGFLSTTPLQMANVVAAIVNDGVIYRPHLLKEIRQAGTDKVLERTVPEKLHEIPYLDTVDYKKIRRAMRGVVAKGTGRWAIYTQATEVAGKTGTGEIGLEDQWHDWFVAYGPHETRNPEERVVVVAFVEASDSYDWWAPKATDIVFEGIFSGRSYEQVIALWRQKGVWWSWDTKDLPLPSTDPIPLDS